MKIFKILLIVILVFSVIFISASAFILSNGRKILLSQLKKNLGIEAEVSDLKVALPASIIIENFSVKDDLKVARLILSPDLLALLRRDIVLRSIILEKPEIKITRNPDDSYNIGIFVYKKDGELVMPKAPVLESGAGDKQESQAQAMLSKKTSPSVEPEKFYLNRLKIKDGTVRFIDRNISSEEPFRLNFSNFNFSVSHLLLPKASHANFKGDANVVSEDGQKAGILDISGWIDILGRDMDADVSLADVRVPVLKPYYKEYLKRELKSGNLLLQASLKSKNNDLKVDCHLELSDIAYEEPQGEPASGEENAKAEDLTFFAFDSIFLTEGRAVFDFSFSTKLDSPKFENVKIKGTFLQPKIEKILSQPTEKTVKDFKEMGKQFKDIGKQFKEIFKSK